MKRKKYVSDNPRLNAEWHPTKNGDLKPSVVTTLSHKKVWWLCEEGHDWLATVAGRSSGKGCPYCAGKKVWPGYNDLATLNPELAAEWHPTKNGDLKPSMVNPSSYKVWCLRNGDASNVTAIEVDTTFSSLISADQRMQKSASEASENKNLL